MNLIEQITKAKPSYSKAFQRLADFVIRKPFAVTAMSIEELAQQADVSVASVNRFAHKCGFSGYPQFRQVLRAHYNNLLEPEEKISLQQETDLNQLLTQILAQDHEHLNHCQQQLSDANLDKALQLINQANNIYVVGMGVSALHAALLVNCIEPFLFKKIKEINALCGLERAFRYLNMLDEHDLIIAISLPRYSKSIVELLQIVRERGAKVLAMTDAPTSPIVPYCDLALFVPSDHPILHTSNVAMVALIECLSSAVALSLSDSTENLTKQTESLIPYFYIPKN